MSVNALARFATGRSVDSHDAISARTERSGAFGVRDEIDTGDRG